MRTHAKGNLPYFTVIYNLYPLFWECLIWLKFCCNSNSVSKLQIYLFGIEFDLENLKNLVLQRWRTRKFFVCYFCDLEWPSHASLHTSRSVIWTEVRGHSFLIQTHGRWPFATAGNQACHTRVAGERPTTETPVEKSEQKNFKSRLHRFRFCGFSPQNDNLFQFLLLLPLWRSPWDNLNVCS